jgi:protocatechuate 3,4-dioxygenase beta subunit
MGNEHTDDVTVGRVLSRREVVGLLGLSGAAMLADPWKGHAGPQPAPAAMTPCVVQPQQTEGPYFVDGMLHRGDIRAEPPSGPAKAGVPLRIAFHVSRMTADGACTPLAGAHVDLWQCDALGVYSGVQDRSFNTVGQKFLRGYQLTDAKGVARFVTIYPGWYQGRAVHVHFKIRTDPSAAAGQEFTSQLYFDEALTDRVHGLEPYSSKGQGRTRNESDGIYRNGGAQLILALGTEGDGYAGAFNVAMHPGIKPEGGPGGRRGRGGRG